MTPENQQITIITPCYNEGPVVAGFLRLLELTLCRLPYTFCVLVVNDCSTDDTREALRHFHFAAGNVSLSILDLEVNLGHQAAIYQGLLFAQGLAGDRFIIMDADGQDAPAVIPELLQHTHSDIVHVTRGHRQESLLFRAGYAIYKATFRLLTGRRMNFGNYCLISHRVMDAAVSAGFLHLPAFLAKQQVPKSYVRAARDKRLGGHSKMGFGKLVRHAAISFREYAGPKPSRL